MSETHPETGLIHSWLALVTPRSPRWQDVESRPTLLGRIDIPHEVTKLEDGYRAVMAFKIFRADDEPGVLPAQLEDRVKEILDQIH